MLPGANRLLVSIPTASPDGKFYGRYPNGTRPAGAALAGAAISSSTASAVFAGGFTDADADFTARASSAGIVWAHDFSSLNELNAFLDQDPSSASWAYIPGGGINAGAIELTIPSNAVNNTLSLTRVDSTHASCTVDGTTGISVGDPVLFLGIPSSSDWDIFNDPGDAQGGGGIVDTYTVTAVTSSTQFTFLCTGSNTGAHAPPSDTFTGPVSGCTTRRARVAVGAWHRPLSGIPATLNGRTADDPGIANLGMPSRNWQIINAAPGARPNYSYNWRFDWWGHSQYAADLATWPDSGGNPTSNNYRGADFWFQIVVKITGRAHDYNDPTRDTIGTTLKFFGAWAIMGTPLHEMILMDSDTSANYSTWLASYGGDFEYAYTGEGYAETLFKGNTIQAGGDFNDTCVFVDGADRPTSETACWRQQDGQWMVYLIHVIPGVNVDGWAGWPNPPDPSTATGLQVWATTESRINAQLAAGLTPDYQSVINTVGANGWPFQYDNGDYKTAGIDLNNPAPAYSSLWLTSYQNSIPVKNGWTRRYAQVLCKMGNGGTDVTDGIACPTVMPSSPVAAPWFTALAHKEWGTPVSNWVGSVLDPNADVQPYYATTGPSSIFGTWTGMGADQTRNVIWLAGNGGHNDFANNAVYSCDLTQSNPTWIRNRSASGTVDPTHTSAIASISWAAGLVTVETSAPIEAVSTGNLAAGADFPTVVAGNTPSGYNSGSNGITVSITGASSFTYPLASNPGVATVLGTFTDNDFQWAIWPDGTPPADHTGCHQVGAEGRWIKAGLGSPNWSGSPRGDAWWEFDPVAEDWIYWGDGFLPDFYAITASAVYDPWDEQIIKVHSSSGQNFEFVDLATKAPVHYTTANYFNSSSMCYGAVDLAHRLLIVQATDIAGTIYVMDMANKAAGAYAVAVTGTPPQYSGYSDVAFWWHNASGAFVSWDPIAGLKKLTLTYSGNTVTAAAWTTVAGQTGTIPTVGSNMSGGIYNKLQFMEEMGNGDAALVLYAQYGFPDVYVLRLSGPLT